MDELWNHFSILYVNDSEEGTKSSSLKYREDNEVGLKALVTAIRKINQNDHPTILKSDECQYV